MPISPSLQWLGLAAEATKGTVAAPTAFIPMTGPQWTPDQTMLENTSIAGSMVNLYSLVEGVRNDSFEFGGDVFGDSFPNLVRAVLGSTDTVTGSSPAFTHKMGLLNNANSGQPPTYTLSYFDGDQCPQMAAAQCDNIALKFSAAGFLEYTTKFLSNPAVDATTVPTQTLDTSLPFPAWDCVATIGGVAVTRISDGELDLKRNVKVINALTGAQGPYALWAGPLDCSGKLTLIYEAGEADLDEYLNNTQPSLDLKFTNPAVTTQTLEFHMSVVGFKTGKVDPGKEYLTTDLEFVGIPNATDAVAGGVSPIAFTAVNAQTAAY